MCEKIKQMKPEDIVLAVCDLVVLYVVPIFFYIDSYKKGYDVTDTGFVLCLVIIPLMGCIVSFFYVLITGRLYRCVILAAYCGLPSALIPILGGGICLIMVIVSLISGAVGRLIHGMIKEWRK